MVRRVIPHTVRYIPRALFFYVLMLYGVEAGAIPPDLGWVLQSLAETRFQISITPVNHEKPIELVTDLTPEELQVTAGGSVESQEGRIRIQTHSRQPAELSISGKSLWGIRHLMNCSRVRIYPGPDAKQQTPDYLEGMFRKKLESELSSGVYKYQKSIWAEDLWSSRLSASIDPSLVVPVFIFNGTSATATSSSASTMVSPVATRPVETVRPTPVPAVSARRKAGPGRSRFTRNLSDMAGLCGVCLAMTGADCRAQATSYSLAAAGMGTGLLIGAILGILLQDNLYFSVGGACVFGLGFLGYCIGRVIDNFCPPCAGKDKTDDNESGPEPDRPPCYQGPSKARQLAAIVEEDEDIDLVEVCGEKQEAGGEEESRREIEVIVEIEAETPPDPECKEKPEEAKKHRARSSIE